MPDLSLFKPLCELLDISINELMSGQDVKEDDYQKTLEENIINITEYKEKKQRDILGFFICLFIGIVLFLSGISFHEEQHLFFTYLFEISSILFILYALFKLTKNLNIFLNISILISTFIFLFCIIKHFDIEMMEDYGYPPRYYYSKVTTGKCVIYKSLFQSGYKNSDYGEKVYLITQADEYEKVLERCNKK